MINEEISNRTLSIEIKAAKDISSEILKAVRRMYAEAKQRGGLNNYIKQEANEVRLKDMVKKGQLEEIPVKEAELKELKKELNKYGVKFSVMRDKETGNYNVFFQSKDTKIMDIAFSKALAKAGKKHDRKESVRKQIDILKDKIKDTVDKDKVKNKHKEQSLW